MTGLRNWTIYKYPLSVVDEQTVSMPAGAKVISAQVQRGALCVWAVVDTNAPPIDVQFRVFGTGHPFDLVEGTGWSFLDTVQLHGGELVFHVFMKEVP